MAKKNKKQLSFYEIISKIKNAGLELSDPLVDNSNDDSLEPVADRIKKIIEIFNSHKNNHEMLYFIMYDIENNKVRTQIAKYIIRNGGLRVQKSVFIADTKRETYDKMHKTLKEINKLYDNQDSIIFVPVSVDFLRSMKLIGQNIDFELITNRRNTMFF
ncbi:MAG: hypothetical protein Kow0068_17480 [Marinilabiliales bacterium]